MCVNDQEIDLDNIDSILSTLTSPMSVSIVTVVTSFPYRLQQI